LRIPCALIVCLFTTACGWTPADEQFLTKFFERSRAYDTTRLAPVATVVFDPTTQGVVQRFRIVKREEAATAGGRGARLLTLQADVGSAGRVSERTLMVTMEQRDGSWVVTHVE
jgi:hypothetical protein